MTKLEIGDIVKPIGQTWEKELEAIKTTKEGTAFLVGGLWWGEEYLTLIQPVGTDWKVGAMARFTNTVRDRDFVIGKIERFGNSNYTLFPDGHSHTSYIASYCKLIATDKCPEANEDWTGKIVRCISIAAWRANNDEKTCPQLEKLYVVRGQMTPGYIMLNEFLYPLINEWSRDHFKLVGDVPQSLALKVDPTLYEETIQKRNEDVRSLSEENKKLTTRLEELEKQNQDTQILVNRIKKLKELITPVAQILDI